LKKKGKDWVNSLNDFTRGYSPKKIAPRQKKKIPFAMTKKHLTLNRQYFRCILSRDDDWRVFREHLLVGRKKQAKNQFFINLD
jgi:hypothetical protein